MSPSALDYSEVDGLQLNIPPRINSAKSEVLVVIRENDEARGTIRFTRSTLLVREESGAVVLQLVREGKFGFLESLKAAARKSVENLGLNLTTGFFNDLATPYSIAFVKLVVGQS